MKRSWLFWIVGLLLTTIIPVMVKILPTPLPDKACSPLYQRYAEDPGVEASFVKGFRINDTLAIDATLLHATDSASWERLLNDFHMPNCFTGKQSSKAVIFRFAEKGQTKPIIDTNMLNNDFLAFSHAEKRITIFHITNEDQIDLCMQNMLD